MTARSLARHELLAHTADVGLRVEAPDLATLFVESALALAGLAADVGPDAVELPLQRVELAAPDLTALAFTWLNELIGLAEVRRAALHGALVESIGPARPLDGSGAEPSAAWRLVGAVRLVAYDDPAVRPRLGVKSATYHGLSVQQVADGWTLTAYLDV